MRAQGAAVWIVAAGLAGCRDAGGARTASSARASARPPLVADVACASGAKCRAANGPLQLQMRAYHDVAFTVVAANDELLGATVIQTAYFDSLSSLDPLVSFTLRRRARVYVAGMFQTPPPSWLEGWSVGPFANKWPWGLQLMVDPKVPEVAGLTLYFKDFEPGPIALGPPQAVPGQPDGTVMMYLVVLDEDAAGR